MPNQTRISEAYTIYKNEKWWDEEGISRQNINKMYGTLLGAIVFYKGVLVDMDFNMNEYNDGSGVTRVNVPETSLVLDSGATIHFFSN